MSTHDSKGLDQKARCSNEGFCHECNTKSEAMYCLICRTILVKHLRAQMSSGKEKAIWERVKKAIRGDKTLIKRYDILYQANVDCELNEPSSHSRISYAICLQYYYAFFGNYSLCSFKSHTDKYYIIKEALSITDQDILEKETPPKIVELPDEHSEEQSDAKIIRDTYHFTIPDNFYYKHLNQTKEDLGIFDTENSKNNEDKDEIEKEIPKLQPTISPPD